MTHKLRVILPFVKVSEGEEQGKEGGGGEKERGVTDMWSANPKIFTKWAFYRKTVPILTDVPYWPSSNQTQQIRHLAFFF